MLFEHTKTVLSFEYADNKTLKIVSVLPDYVVSGNWLCDAYDNWMFKDLNGKEYRTTWAAIYNPYSDASRGQSAYDWFYFDELKYSAINDFTHLCTFKYKTAPEFHARVHNGEHYVDIYLNNKKEFTGKGESVESAKANAAILGLKYFSNK